MLVRRLGTVAAALLLSHVLLVLPAAAGAGDPDPSFGADGSVAPPPAEGGGIEAVAWAPLVTAAGLVVVGTSSFEGRHEIVVMRYADDGSLDDAYGAGGVVRTGLTGFRPKQPVAVAHKDGSVSFLHVVGADDVGLGHVDANGRYVPSRHRELTLSDEQDLQALVLMPDGDLSLLVTNFEQHSSTIFRFEADGSPDTAFGQGGVTTIADMWLYQLVVSGDGVLYATGHDLAASTRDIIRLTSQGAIDPAFGDGGQFAYPSVRDDTYTQILDLEWSPDSDLVAVVTREHVGDGEHTQTAHLVRLTPDGMQTLDVETTGPGIVYAAFGGDITFGANGIYLLERRCRQARATEEDCADEVMHVQHVAADGTANSGWPGLDLEYLADITTDAQGRLISAGLGTNGRPLWNLRRHDGAPDAPSPPALSRLAGPDRYATAARIAQSSYPSGPVPVVVIASGEAFADALASGPAAHVLGGPVLPVGSTTVPSVIREELVRLRPGRIVVVGGAAAVSPAVEAELQQYTTGGVERIAGSNRYDTAAQVAERTFTPATGGVVIASGLGFADSLAGGAAGARTGSPILLVGPDQLPAETAAALRTLEPTSLTVLGGPLAVSDEVLREVEAETGLTAVRHAGATRFDTAAQTVAAFWPNTSETVYVTTGTQFPDALSGTPAAALQDAPLLLVQATCMPAATKAQLARLQPRRIVALGGPASLSDAAARGASVC